MTDPSTPATMLDSTVRFLGETVGGHTAPMDATGLLHSLFTADVESDEFWVSYQSMRDLYNRVQGASTVISAAGLETVEGVPGFEGKTFVGYEPSETRH